MLRDLAKVGVIVLCINIMLTLGGISGGVNLVEDVNKTAMNVSSMTPTAISDVVLSIGSIAFKIGFASIALLANAGLPWQIRLLIGLPLAMLNMYFLLNIMYYIIGAIKKVLPW